LAFWLYRGRAVELTLLGVHAVGLVLNAATGNLRHSHVWLGFGPRVERWLISPAQHQLHHSAAPAGHDCNYGTWLACWDRLGGTLKPSGARAPSTFGVAASERNHAADDLVSALLGPIGAILRRARPLRVPASGAALLALALPAHA